MTVGAVTSSCPDQAHEKLVTWGLCHDDSGPAELFRLEVLICTVTVSLGKGPHIIKLKFNVTVKGAAERRGRRAGPVT